MANITMDMIKDLRERTGVGIMDCKKALSESDGDIDKAVRLLKERGAVAAAKKSERTAKEGIIKIFVNDEKNHIAYAELQCETDFVAKNEIFQTLADDIVSIVASIDNPTVDTVLATKTASGDTVLDMINALVQKMGEKTVLSKVMNIKTSGFFGVYKHFTNKLLTIVEFDCKPKTEKSYELANQIAMHTASEKPLAMNRDGLDEVAVKEQREIFEKITTDSGKTGDMVGKIVEGKMNAWFSESVLIDQKLFTDNKITIKSLIDELSKDSGNICNIKSMHIAEITA